MSYPKRLTESQRPIQSTELKKLTPKYNDETFQGIVPGSLSGAIMKRGERNYAWVQDPKLQLYLI